MAAIEVWKPGQPGWRVELELVGYTIGFDPRECEIAIDDPTVSSVHARVDRVGTTWEVRDLGSKNGTFAGNVRIHQPTRLRDGTELRVGRTTLVFRDPASRRQRKTEAVEPAPDNITRTERKVLLELCRPLLEHHHLAIPATERAMADRLGVGRGAVRAHLLNLYDKFGIRLDPGVNRRTELAKAAVDRNAVNRTDLDEYDERRERGAD